MCEVRGSIDCDVCGKECSNPEVVEGVAYFVCSNCGNVVEKEDKNLLFEPDAIRKFEEKQNLRLPSQIIEYWGLTTSWEVKLPPCVSESTKFYFGEGFYSVRGGVANRQWLFDSPGLVKEWGLPKDIVLLEGDGHTWLALDYRDCRAEPTVIVIETDEGYSLTVANSLSRFLTSLIPYEKVYDVDGNMIYKETKTFE